MMIVAKRILLVLGLLFFVGSCSAAYTTSPVFATANARGDICGGLTASGQSSGNCGGASGVTLQDVVNVTIDVLSLLIGVLAIIMIMVSGFRYVTAGGDTGKISSAKTTLIYAVVGLIIAAFAKFFVQFVLNKLGI